MLHIVESFGAGVAAALESYREVSRNSWSHEILGFRRVGAQIDVDSEPLAGFTRLPGGKIAQLIAIRRRVTTTHADVIHAHSSWAGFFTRVARKRGGPPIVYSPHCFAFERTTSTRISRAVYRQIERQLGRRTEVFATVGQHEAARAQRLCPSTPTTVIPHALSVEVLDALRSLPRPTPTKSLRAATVARIARQKDIDYFIAVKQHVELLVPEANSIEFTWIGGGDRRLTSRLTAAGVVVTGWLPRRQALQQLAHVDVYLHSAAWEAGWPLSLLEAAHARRPIVCRRIHASRGLPASFLVDGPAAMAQRLLVLADPAARDDAIAEVDRFVERCASPADQATALNTTYSTALRRAAARRSGR